MNNRKFINFLAYISVAIIAVALVLNFFSSKVFYWDSQVSDWCKNIAFYVAGFITVISAFAYAGSKRNISYMVFLVVFLILIISFTFIW